MAGDSTYLTAFAFPLSLPVAFLAREIYRSSFFVFFSPLSLLPPSSSLGGADGKHLEGMRPSGERGRGDGSEPYLFLVDLFRLIHLLSRDSLPFPPSTYFRVDLFASYKCGVCVREIFLKYWLSYDPTGSYRSNSNLCCFFLLKSRNDDSLLNNTFTFQCLMPSSDLISTRRDEEMAKPFPPLPF